MARLEVKIGGDATGFQRAVAEVKATAGRASTELQKSFAPKGGLLGGASKVLPVVGGIAAVGYAARAAAGYLDEMATAGDDIDKGSRRLGISAEEYQRLSIAIGYAGGSIEQMEPAFARLSTVLLGADEDSKASQKALERLGLTMADLAGKSRYAQMDTILRALAKIPDASTRAAAGQQVLSESFKNLMPLVDDYVNQVERANKQSIISDDNIKAAANLKDDLADITQNLSAMVSNMGLLKAASSALKTAAQLPDFIEWAFFPQDLQTQKEEALAALSEVSRARRIAATAKPEQEAQKIKSLADAIKSQVEAEKEARAQAAKTAEEAISSLREKIHEQEMVNAGKQRELAIEKEVAALREKMPAGQEFSTTGDLSFDVIEPTVIQPDVIEPTVIQPDVIEPKVIQPDPIEINAVGQFPADTEATVRELAGKLFDLRNQKIPVLPESPQATQLERIGAILGGGRGDDKQANISREILSVNKRQLDIATRQLEKTESAALGVV